jgi:hypothetical protein
VKGKALRRAGGIAGLVAGPFFLISVGLNSWASIDYLHRLGWAFVGGEQVPWPSSLASGPYGWVQVATFVITGLLMMVLAIAVRDQLPRRRASSFAVLLLGLLGVALILAAFRVDTSMLRGGNPDTWHGWIHGCPRATDYGVRGARRPKLAADRGRFGCRYCPPGCIPDLPLGQRPISDGNPHSVRLDRSTCRAPHNPSLVNNSCSPSIGPTDV